MATYRRLGIPGLTKAQAKGLIDFCISTNRTGVEGVQCEYNGATGLFELDVGGRNINNFLTTLRGRLALVGGQALSTDRSLALSETRIKAREDQNRR